MAFILEHRIRRQNIAIWHIIQNCPMMQYFKLDVYDDFPQVEIWPGLAIAFFLIPLKIFLIDSLTAAAADCFCAWHKAINNKF